MTTLSRLLLMIVAMLGLSMSWADAQSSKWTINVGADVEYSTFSPDGERLLTITNDDYAVATCVNTRNGAKLWTRTLEDFEQYKVCRFLNNDSVLLGQKRVYELVNATNGSVLGTLPIADESWDDLRVEYSTDPDHDSLSPYFDGGIGIFYFDRAMQILDLEKFTVLYQTGWSPNKIKYYRWGPALMINPRGGGDTIYFVDVTKRAMIYKVSAYDSDINSSVYQPFAATASELLLFNERNIESIDMATGKKNATIEVDPDDPEYYSPVIFKDALYLMVSDDDIQTMYRTKDGVQLWKTQPEEIKGLVEQVIELPNDEAILVTYDLEGLVSAIKVNATTGKIAWRRPLFVQESRLEPGHKEGSRFLAALATIAVSVGKAYLRSALNSSLNQSHWRRDPSTGLIEPNYRYNSFAARREREADREFVNNMYNSWVNKKKVTPGYASLVTRDEKQMTLALVGRIYEPVKGTADTYDGEAMLTVNLGDGSIAQSRPFEMLGRSDTKGFNAFRDMRMVSVGSFKVLVGIHDVYVVRGEAVERISFGESAVTLLDSSSTSISIMVNHDDEIYDFWRYDVSGPTTQQALIARSQYANVLLLDSIAPATTIRYTPERIEAFPLITGVVTDASFATPKWTLTEADLDKMEFGDLDENVGAKTRTQGIAVIGGDVFFLGDDGLAFVSSDGGCRWSKEWSPDVLRQRLGVTKVGDAVAYSMGSNTRVFATACPGAEIGSVESSFTSTDVRLTDSGTLVVIDRGENIISGFIMKK